MPRVRTTAVRSVCILILLAGLIGCAPLYFFRSDAAALQFGDAANSSSAQALLAQPDERQRASFAQAYGKLPLSFEANRGQAHSQVKFISRGSGYSLFLTPEEAVLALSKPAAAPAVLRMKLVGANPAPRVEGMELQPLKTSYFIGNDRRQWQTNVDGYAKVSYREVYPGIDLLYYGNQQQLEYDFLVSPGASPEQIRLSFTGAEKLFIDKDGELVLRTAAGDVRQHRPLLYQEVDGERREVKGRYVMRGRQVGFRVGEYDRSRALIIDPVLIYSTYLGGDFDDRGYSIAVDAAGCAYVAGLTTSSDFPPPSPIQPAPHPDQNRDAFVLKLNAAGTAVLYATYLGGAAYEQASSIAVDASGSAYVVGSTNSADFPTKDALQASLRGKYDLFLTKLNPEGTALTYSTYLGGTNGETASGVAVDGGGNAYLTGHTDSTDFPVANALQDKRRGDAVFRSTDSGNTWNAGSTGLGAAQVVAFAVNPASPSTVYAAADTGVFKSTDGGNSWSPTGPLPLPSSIYISTPLTDIVIDPVNPLTLYVSSFHGIFKSVDGGDHWSAINTGIVTYDQQVMRLAIDPSNPLTLYAGISFGSHPVYKSIDGGLSWNPSDAGLQSYAYLGMSDLDIDASNPSIIYALIACVISKSTDGGSSWKVFNYHTFNGGRAYTITLDPSNPSTLYVGTDLGIWKSTNGGVSMTRLTANPRYTPSIVVDPSNPSVLYASTFDRQIARSTDGGQTWTNSTADFAHDLFLEYDIILAINPADTSKLYAGGYSGSDAFLMKLDPAGAQLLYSTYLGGTSVETATGIALDSSGNAYISGATDSANFPTVNPLQQASGGGKDAYAAKVNATGSSLVYATYLGGQHDDEAYDIAVDGAGGAYLTGYTRSANFPTLNSIRQPKCDVCDIPNYITHDAFVTKLNATGSALVYSTFLGGNGEDYGNDIAVDASSNAYVIGYTQSTDLFVFGAPQKTKSRLEDVFVSELDSTGTSLLYSTYLGGNDRDFGTAIAVGPDGSTYITGRTFSADFPVANALQGTKKASYDTFITKLGPETSNGARADLSVTQTDSPDPAGFGEGTTYTFTITNHGPSTATGVVLNDPQSPFEVTLGTATSSQGQCSKDPIGTFTCNLGTLAVGAQATVKITAGSQWIKTVSNTGVVGGNEPDPNLSNNTATQQTVILDSRDIEGSVRDGNGKPVSGVTVTLSGTRNASMPTLDGSRYFFLNLPVGGTYTVTPSSPNYAFSPASRTFDNLSADQIGNFTAVPLLSISGATVSEGNAGTKNAVFSVSLSGPTSQAVTVAYATSELSATSGADYQPVSGTLTFNPGVTTQSISVPIVGDTMDEPDESFTVTLSNPTNAVLGPTASAQGTITDDDESPTVSINNVSLTEGDAGVKSAAFTVNLSAASARPISVAYTTADATATSGSDYVSTSGTLSFNPGETTRSISVNINGDVTAEADETFTVVLSNPTNSVTGTSVGTATIVNDDAAGSLQFGSLASSVDEGAGTVTITVTRTLGSSGTVTVNYATVNATATAGEDYVAASGTLSFGNEETTKSFTVKINDDSVFEGDETFNLMLSNPTGGASQGTPGTTSVSITDNDQPPPVLQFSQAAYTVAEGAGFLNITVARSGNTAAPASVKYATSDAADANFRCDPTTPGQPTDVASRKCDYHISVGTLRFAAGEATRQFTLSLVNDVYVEGPETFTLTLSNPTGASLGQNQSVPVTITDDDQAGAANPLDNTSFFVRQLYVDLLSREPDPAGWQGWTTRIDQCGLPGQPPPPCDRVTVGGDGFLRSGEFFDRQFFVLRLYRTGLGRILRYDEVADLAYVSGFLTAEQLELNKQELVSEMVLRDEFSARYNPLSNAAYVATLLQTAGVSVPQAAQDSWVSALDNSGKSRAQVLREISERDEVSSKYLHEAQVVSAYYGFFTRNPDGAYLNYLQRLDSGEITLADLANAFINAQEYRQRFGP